MSLRVFDQIRNSLLVRRENLAEWLFSTPASKRRLQLGTEPEQEVQEQLESLDSAIAKAEDETLGLCSVCHETVETRLLEMDYTACVCLDHLSEEDRRTLEFELEMAMTVQRSLLPHQAPEIPHLEVAAFSRPAQMLGGDYFDFLEFGDGRWGLVIADVAGHGISASLHMAAMQTLLRAFTPLASAPAEVVAHLHRVLIHNAQFTTFVTIFLGAFDPEKGVLTYTNAGHNPPLILRSSQQNERATEPAFEWLNPTAAAVGLVEDASFDHGTAELHPGDHLLLYTDGIVETTDDQNRQFGADRLAQLLWRERSQPVSRIPAAIKTELDRFAGGEPPADDITLVVARVTD